MIDCKGTEWFHNGKKYLCDGDRFIVLKYWPDSDTPKLVAMCPCKSLDNLDNLERYIRKKLGFRNNIDLWDTQKLGFQTIKHSRNIFIYGESQSGKTVLLEYFLIYLIEQHEKSIKSKKNKEHSKTQTLPELRIFVGPELPVMLTELMLGQYDRAPNWHGLLVIDDIDKINPTAFIQTQLWYLFDRVDKEKLNIICTSNMMPKDCMNKLFQNDPVRAQTIRERIKKINVLNLTKKEVTLIEG